MIAPANTMAADARVFVALDLPSVDEARAMAATLGDSVASYKIGLQLLPIGGVELGRELRAQGKNVFLDFKFHDIDATVEKATASVAGLDAQLLTVHARPDVMRASVRGKGGSNLKILGVTVLTSLDKQALEDIGYNDNAEDLVMRRVRQALDAGVDGVVASPLEAAAIRSVVPDSFLVVTPGVRPTGSAAGDQKRIATPSAALSSGATHLVIGRPVTQAEDPAHAARAIMAEIDGVDFRRR
ncbi:orotidine 5'-phosphate decarboxylase [Algimonas porphyrae]|uniref:Orotidine 5'-phosphate decarboxylase n=2 Tax=Algimonas porphyrae TaxID=1128113 RepID=A0ABQ5V029_9PROT|nr:orotidine-5'-phosphate decarboxylase [Algimonas porphyrae]GLQ20899.1 orotidine 5'-phosphate decarboxylase [Algimonas porphyrae]